MYEMSRFLSEQMPAAVVVIFTPPRSAQKATINYGMRRAASIKKPIQNIYLHNRERKKRHAPFVRPNPGGEPRQGGVVWTKGNLTVRGGTFARNAADDAGGVFKLSDGCTATLVDGRFEGNEAGGGGGAVSVVSGAKLLVEGGEYSENEARVNGGAFYVDEEGDIEVRREHAARRHRGHPLIGNVSPIDLLLRIDGLEN